MKPTARQLVADANRLGAVVRAVRSDMPEVVDNAQYAKIHRAEMAHEGARWRAMVALAEEAGLL